MKREGNFKCGFYLCGVAAWLSVSFMLAGCRKEVNANIGAAPLSDLRTAAVRGDINAQTALGLRYFEGRGVPPNPDEALLWWKKAEEHGSTAAQFYLGLLYHKGLGRMPPNKPLARQWWYKAGNGGYAEAQYNLGVVHLHGDGVATNQAEAATWFRKAAAQGFIQAQLALAI